MDFPLSFLSSFLPEDFEQAIARISEMVPDSLRQILRHASAYMPMELDLASSAEFMLYFAAASLILGGLSRVVLGKRSSLNHSLSSVMGILLIYAVTVVVYTFKPWNLQSLLSPLPFVTFSGEFLFLFPIIGAPFPALCTQVLSMIILAFLVNLLDTIFPQGKSPISWYLMRFVCVIIAMLVHLVVQWAVSIYLPELMVEYAPTVLLIVLAIMLLSGIISLILGMVIAVSNPFLGAMYSFFFSNIIGKQVSKSVFTTGVLCIIVYLLEYFEYSVIIISTAALATYIPLVILLLLLWYLIGHVL